MLARRPTSAFCICFVLGSNWSLLASTVFWSVCPRMIQVMSQMIQVMSQWNSFIHFRRNKPFCSNSNCDLYSSESCLTRNWRVWRLWAFCTSMLLIDWLIFVASLETLTRLSRNFFSEYKILSTKKQHQRNPINVVTIETKISVSRNFSFFFFFVFFFTWKHPKEEKRELFGLFFGVPKRSWMTLEQSKRCRQSVGELGCCNVLSKADQSVMHHVWSEFDSLFSFVQKIGACLRYCQSIGGRACRFHFGTTVLRSPFLACQMPSKRVL